VIRLDAAAAQNQRTFKFSATGIGIIVSAAVLLLFMSIPEFIPSQVSAQIIPTLNPETSNGGIGFTVQESADPVQNGTNANITQLATIPAAANQPITPSTFTPVSEDTGDSDVSSSNDDDDDDESDNDSDNDSDEGDDSNDDGDSSAFAGGGGAIAFAG
jgi:hypothetical protein